MVFGNVKVLITYNETEEVIPIYNKKDKHSTTNETDSSGGTRAIEEIDNSQEIVYQNDKIITGKIISPKIEGAVITASGARKFDSEIQYYSSSRSCNRSCYSQNTSFWNELGGGIYENN